MKKLFLDTNFVIDYFIRENSGGSAEELLVTGKANNYSFYISYLTIANFAYIMRKMPPENLRSLIERICSGFIIVSNTKDQIIEALALNATDFEDGLQYACAIDSGCSCIISRNQRDFVFSKIPVMSASEFMAHNF